MKKIMLKDCILDKKNLNEVIAIAIFGSYHEKSFDKNRSDIDLLILLKKEVEIEREFEIEEYLENILKEYFNHNNIHCTFINDFNYPFSELLLISKDKIIFKEEQYLNYTLGYSVFKRDREFLEIMKEENLRELEEFKNGLL
ncbi:MAG: nucleotidyltransferase domain-containing protein [Sarcina sp.]